MRIGIDGTCLANRRGFGRFARELVRALAELNSGHEFLVFLDRPSLCSGAVDVPGSMAVCEVEVAQAPARAASARGRRRVRDMIAMSRAVARAGLDLMFFPSTYSYFPVWKVPRVVVTVHDTIPLDFPELIFPTRVGRWAWTIKERAAVARADLIVTNSEASRRGLARHYGRASMRARVVSWAASAIFTPQGDSSYRADVLRRYGIDPTRRFLLYVGGLSPHKNLIRLIDAFALACDEATQLVLVGDFADVFHTHIAELRATAVERRVAQRAIFTGFVPDENLVYIYSAAHALVQPSLVEGFGLPPIEAMACGTPVVASAAGSLPEVVGEAGRYFDPTNTEEMAESLREILSDTALREELASRALRRSQRFTWQQTARDVLYVLEEAAGPAISRRGA